MSGTLDGAPRASVTEPDTTSSTAHDTPSGATRRQRIRQWAFPLGVWALSRVACGVAGVVGTYVRGDVPFSEWFASWDGAWYQEVIRVGYPSELPYADGHMLPNTIAFFPGYPLAGRAFGFLPFGDAITLLLVSLVAGAVATVLIWITAETLWDRAVADRAALLFVFSPGAFVLSWAYSEALLLALSIGCLLALSRRRWVVAGILGALGTATRPNAIVLVACSALAAAIAIHKDRDWKALAAPTLAPLGIVAFFGYLWARTGVSDAWFRVERDVWQSKIDFGERLLDFLNRFAHHPTGSSPETLVALTTILAIVGLAVMLSVRSLPPTYQLFGVWMVLLPVLSAELLMRPRWLFSAFPIVLAVAYRLGARWTPPVVAVSASAMGLLIVYYGYFGGTAIVPP